MEKPERQPLSPTPDRPVDGVLSSSRKVELSCIGHREGGRLADTGVSIGTAVLVHGSWSSPSDWRWVRDLLDAAGMACDAVDLPSHQQANATRHDDVAAVEAAVQRAIGPVVAVGWSYGGAVIGDLDVESAPVEHLLYLASVPHVVDASSVGERPQSQPDPSLLLFPTADTFVLDDDRWLVEGPGIDRFSPEVMDHLWTNRRRPMALGAIGTSRTRGVATGPHHPAARERRPPGAIGASGVGGTATGDHSACRG